MIKNLKVTDIEKMSFEEAFEELNKIIDFIEGGDISLDDSIKIYEMGIQLKKHCEKKLKDAEIKIKKVVDEKIEPI
ncbi:MAG: exodeoxyribonuclease VII small subunit [Pseudomonadota bacterium]|nr:exodeoxyribonuclease VII small subunit [Pseudomonadota bacterium]